jgi:hypothetical protein
MIRVECLDPIRGDTRFIMICDASLPKAQENIDRLRVNQYYTAAQLLSTILLNMSTGTLKYLEELPGMGKQRKRRWEGKRPQQQKKHGSDKKTPESLMAQGNLQEAARLLRAHIRMTPSDEKKRLLGQCLFQLGDYREAAQA